MIRPPFTLLLIKKAHEPVTLHITTSFLLLLMLLFTLSSLAAGFGIASFSPKFELPFLTTESISPSENSDPGLVTMTPALSEDENNTLSTVPEIKNLSIARRNESDLEINFSFINISEHEHVYIWLIINPDSYSGSETVIYPRNPMFRGMPVDYRNGVEYIPLDNKDFELSLSELIEGILVNKIRILAYSSEGKIILDKRFNLKKT